MVVRSGAARAVRDAVTPVMEFRFLEAVAARRARRRPNGQTVDEQGRAYVLIKGALVERAEVNGWTYLGTDSYLRLTEAGNLELKTRRERRDNHARMQPRGD